MQHVHTTIFQHCKARIKFSTFFRVDSHSFKLTPFLNVKELEFCCNCIDKTSTIKSKRQIDLNLYSDKYRKREAFDLTTLRRQIFEVLELLNYFIRPFFYNCTLPSPSYKNHM